MPGKAIREGFSEEVAFQLGPDRLGWRQRGKSGDTGLQKKPEHEYCGLAFNNY